TYLAAIDHLDYLKNMGINAIHVMPVSEFEGNSSWGYNPNFYFAPDKYYGTKNDLKKFIDECHKLEIQVFNDLVLNHSFHSNVMVKMFQETSSIAPSTENPWLNNAHKMVRNTAGHWGADWNHESEHTQEMIDRALDFWLQEYNFDGYRFDFTKGFGQTNPEDFPQGDDWASAYNQARVDLLERMVDGMWARNPGSVAIFEHLANATEDKALADEGILMWSGVGHHNDMKGFIMGWPNDNRDIYNSGIYNASGRNFDLQNWMSYMESHDEERLAYELMQFGNGIATEIDEEVKLAKTIDRLKIGAAFNMLFPGPRMIWQFGELGYDYSINFNGRTGEKPVRWDYFQDAKRKELYDLYSTLLNIRNNHYSVYNDINYRNIGAGQEAISTPRVMQLSSGIADNHSESVIVIANLDPNAQQTTTPNYPVAGTWYKYNGDPSIDGTTYTVNNTSDTYTLQPSETLVLTNFQVQFPAALAVAGLTFNGKVENGHAQLNWNTQSEIDNHGFYIEKSLDGEQFADLQFVTGQGTTTKTQFYQFSDNKFKTAAYYRLRQVDLAGKVTYSNVVYLQANATQTPQFSLAPNPWTNDSQLQLDQTATGMITLELVNTAGVVLQRSQGDLTQVNADLRKSLQQATTGTYFARVFNAGKVQVLRIVR
ncbi:MAG: alpha-amylase family glycosyl hydrolase, partial [Saprospiraceae bacterium]